ncbi:MAG: CT583 family protein [Parachlamydiales bacterium]
MERLNNLLGRRLRKPTTATPVPFIGEVVTDEHVREDLRTLLTRYAPEAQEIEGDLQALATITAEVRAINHQAALLHGERIKRAQVVLKPYQEGAFTAWLMSTYGNRQTPYNFLQYYEFHRAMPQEVRPEIEKMPRQAIYTLATRKGTLEEKQEFLEKNAGLTKEELLGRIRETFPLHDTDKRKADIGEQTINLFKRVYRTIKADPYSLSFAQKNEIRSMLSEFHKLLG